MSHLYCLDTSALVESWWRLYPPDSFPTFWEYFDDAIVNNIFVAPEIVLEELKAQDDDIYKWAKNHNELFVPLDTDLQMVQAGIVNQFPRLTMPVKHRSLADPWVIALAIINQCPVVSMENPGSDSKPRIPDVCRHIGVEHIYIVDLIRAMGWKF